MIKRILLISIFFFCLPGISWAHLEGNAKEDKGYRIELGHYPDELITASASIFSVAMEDLEGHGISDVKAWVRISQGNATLFSSPDFITSDGTVDFEYRFEDAGEYEMLVRMVDVKKEQEATVTFSLMVGDQSEEADAAKEVMCVERQSHFNLAVLTLILGLIGGVLLARYRPASNSNS